MSTRKSTTTIILATSMVIFSLLACTVGTYAWFNCQIDYSTHTSSFSVVDTENCALFSADLIKFDFDTKTYGEGEDELVVIDYINPAEGAVNAYPYNSSTNSFDVEAMNTYDPNDFTLLDSGLSAMNCNAIYKFVLQSSSFSTAFLNSVVEQKVVSYDAETQLLLTSCTDFDLFFDSDLEESNPLFHRLDDPSTALVDERDDKLYYPSYKFSSDGKYYKWNPSISDWDITSIAPDGNYRGTKNYASLLVPPPNSGDYYKVNYETEEYDKYYQWDGDEWVLENNRPETGVDKGSLDFENYLPNNPDSGDFYKVKYQVSESNHFHQWNGSEWIESIEEPEGEPLGVLMFDIYLPQTDDYYKVLRTPLSLSDIEETYYKISYLSSMKLSHTHIYPTAQTALATNKEIEFAHDDETGGNLTTVYVNANYAPSKLEDKAEEVYNGNIKAVYDFAFRFNFSAEEVS